MTTTPQHDDGTTEPVPGAQDSAYVRSLVGDDDSADAGDASDLGESLLGPDDDGDGRATDDADGVVPTTGEGAPPAGPASPGAFGPR